VRVQGRQDNNTFDTPIVQIVAADEQTVDRSRPSFPAWSEEPSFTDVYLLDYHLIVRTLGATVTLRIDDPEQRSDEDIDAIHVTEVDRLLHQHTNGRSIVDITVGSSSGSPFFVNDRGNVFRWGSDTSKL
jgi:hypothetical protein